MEGFQKRIGAYKYSRFTLIGAVTRRCSQVRNVTKLSKQTMQ